MNEQNITNMFVIFLINFRLVSLLFKPKIRIMFLKIEMMKKKCSVPRRGAGTWAGGGLGIGFIARG